MKYYILAFSFLMVVFAGCEKKSSPGNNTQLDSMKNAAKGWVEAINTHKLDDLDKYIAQDVIENTSLTTREGKLEKGWLAGIKRLLGGGNTNDPANTEKISIEDIRAEGNICVMRTFTTGIKTLDSSGVMIQKRHNKVETNWMRWENGKFVEGWWDVRD